MVFYLLGGHPCYNVLIKSLVIGIIKATALGKFLSFIYLRAEIMKHNIQVIMEV
jgi:hypothetical protein